MTVGALRVPSGVASFPGTRSGRDRVVRQTATRTGAAADTIAAQFLAGSCRRPGGGGLLRKHGAPGGGTFLSPSSPRLLSLGPGGAGVGRIGGGVGKPPLLFSQDFAGPGPVGELLPGQRRGRRHHRRRADGGRRSYGDPTLQTATGSGPGQVSGPVWKPLGRSTEL